MKKWFNKPRNRTWTGAATGFALIIMMLGITACLLPAPVGNPERSRIDKSISGVWYTVENKSDYDAQIWVFRPWDKRTWLLSVYDLKTSETQSNDTASTSTESEPANTIDSVLEMEVIETNSFKAWKTTLAKTDFLTFEIAQFFDSENGFVHPAGWYLLRSKIDGDTLELTHISYGFVNDIIDELDNTILGEIDEEDFGTRTMRALVEAVISDHANNPDLYDSNPIHLKRVREGDYDDFNDLVNPEY